MKYPVSLYSLNTVYITNYSLDLQWRKTMKTRLSLLSVVLVVFLFMVALPASAAPNPPLGPRQPLKAFVLQEKDLCDGVILESHILNPSDDSNPLKMQVGAADQKGYDSLSIANRYTEAYMSSGIANNGQIAIISFAYSIMIPRN